MIESVEAPILVVGITPAVQRLLHFKKVELGEVNRSLSVVVSAAGKGVNTARVILRLGGSPRLIGFLGGSSGEDLRLEVDREGILSAWVEVVHPTRQCHTLRDMETGEVTELVEEMMGPHPNEWDAFYALYRNYLPESGLVSISGKLPPKAEDEVYARLAEDAVKAGKRFLIDSQGEALRKVLPFEPDLVKINTEELQATTGLEVSNLEQRVLAARWLMERGARQVLITQGADDALLVDRRQAWAFRMPSIQPINPIGCGDTVMGALACGIQKGMTIRKAACFGLAAAASAALTETPGDLMEEEIPGFLEEIEASCREI